MALAGAVAREGQACIVLPNVMAAACPVYLLLPVYQTGQNHSHIMLHSPSHLPNKFLMPENVPGNHPSPPSLLTSFCLLVPSALTWTQTLVLSFDPGPWSFLGARVPGIE